MSSIYYTYQDNFVRHQILKLLLDKFILKLVRNSNFVNESKLPQFLFSILNLFIDAHLIKKCLIFIDCLLKDLYVLKGSLRNVRKLKKNFLF